MENHHVQWKLHLQIVDFPASHVGFFGGGGGVTSKKQKQATNPTWTETNISWSQLGEFHDFFLIKKSSPRKVLWWILPLKGTNQQTKRKLPQQPQKLPKIAQKSPTKFRNHPRFPSFQGAAPMPIKGNMLIITKATNQPCSNQLFSPGKTTENKTTSGGWIPGACLVLTPTGM